MGILLFPAFLLANDLAPDRYIDGEALANLMTDIILRGIGPQLQLENIEIFDLRQKLYWGFAIATDEDAPERRSLLNWLLEQPDGSVKPDQLLKRALVIEEGNLHRALILCWDHLREGWSPGGIPQDGRNNYPHARKLFDLTGELPLLDGYQFSHSMREALNVGVGMIQSGRSSHGKLETVRGDNYSAWYHFFGTALNSFTRTNSRWYPLPGTIETNALIFLEENVLFSYFIDPQKRREIDKAGAIFGDRLSRNLRNYRNFSQFAVSADANNTNYIYDNPEIYGQAWHLLPGQLPRDFGTTNKSYDPTQGTSFQRREVARELIGQNDHASLDKVFAAIRNDDAVIRKFGITALQKRNDSESMDRAAQALADKKISHLILEALAGRSDSNPRAIQLISENFLSSPSAVLQGLLSRESIPAGQEAVGLVKAMDILLSRGVIAEAQQSIAEVLGRIKGDRPVPLLRRLLSSGNPHLRVAASAALSGRNDPGSLAIIRSLLEKRSTWWQRANDAYGKYIVENAILALNGRTDRASVELIHQLYFRGVDPGFRPLLVSTLRGRQEPLALSVAFHAATKDSASRVAAAEVLAARPEPEARRILMRLASDRNSRVARVASRFITQDRERSLKMCVSDALRNMRK